MINKLIPLGYRKAIYGFLLIATGIAVEATIGLSTNLLYLLITISTGFFLGNSVEHASNHGKDVTPNTEINDAVAQLVEQITMVEQKVEQSASSLLPIQQGVGAIVKTLNNLKKNR